MGKNAGKNVYTFNKITGAAAIYKLATPARSIVKHTNFKKCFSLGVFPCRFRSYCLGQGRFWEQAPPFDGYLRTPICV